MSKGFTAVLGFRASDEAIKEASCATLELSMSHSSKWHADLRENGATGGSIYGQISGFLERLGNEIANRRCDKGPGVCPVCPQPKNIGTCPPGYEFPVLRVGASKAEIREAGCDTLGMTEGNYSTATRQMSKFGEERTKKCRDAGIFLTRIEAEICRRERNGCDAKRNCVCGCFGMKEESRKLPKVSAAVPLPASPKPAPKMVTSKAPAKVVTAPNALKRLYLGASDVEMQRCSCDILDMTERHYSSEYHQMWKTDHGANPWFKDTGLFLELIWSEINRRKRDGCNAKGCAGICFEFEEEEAKPPKVSAAVSLPASPNFEGPVEAPKVKVPTLIEFVGPKDAEFYKLSDDIRLKLREKWTKYINEKPRATGVRSMRVLSAMNYYHRYSMDFILTEPNDADRQHVCWLINSLELPSL
jgi:hypothetical protein